VILLGQRTGKAAIERVVAEARAAWPTVRVASKDFERFLAERADGQPVAELHTSDLYLACALAAGDTSALAEFDRQFLSQVPLFIGRVDGAAVSADEVQQVLRSKLFVPEPGERAKILDYSGRGPLGGWLRVVAIRIARNLQRAMKPTVPIDDSGPRAAVLRAPAQDPEMRYVREKYAREFRLAFERTLASLSSQERNTQRLYFIDDMTSDAIAKIYRVTGAAVRHRIKQCRIAILEETRRLLGARLKVDTSELDSLMALVHSQFDLSISRLLKRSG
jgi:RNA polymerase sigma-70 factor (ECF subfamily)